MKRYVIYEELPSSVNPDVMVKYFRMENGDVTTDPKDAKMYKARTWIEFIVTILQVLLKVFGNKNLKYQQIK